MHKAKVWMPIVAHLLVLLFALYSVTVVLLVAKKASVFYKLVAVLVGGAAVWLMLRRDTYLPFLGPAAFPLGLIPEDRAPENSNVEVVLTFDAKHNGKKVIYWGSQPSESVAAFPNPSMAYDNYSNAGVATIQNGKAKLSFFCPSRYNVPWKGTLDRHIHYRMCCKHGLMGGVETVFVNC